MKSMRADEMLQAEFVPFGEMIAARAREQPDRIARRRRDMNRLVEAADGNQLGRRMRRCRYQQEQDGGGGSERTAHEVSPRTRWVPAASTVARSDPVRQPAEPANAVADPRLPSTCPCGRGWRPASLCRRHGGR